MLTIKNNIGVEAKVYAETFEYEAYDQIKKLIDFEPYQKSKVRIMPDAHAGKGCTVGTTMTIDNKVTPNLVGVDIGCFTKDTRVKLADGRDLSFEELINEEDKEHFGFSISQDGSMKISKLEYPRKIKSVDKLCIITLDNGEQIKCTLDHEFLIRSNKYVEAKDLHIGDSLMPLYIKKLNELSGDESCNNTFKKNKLAEYKVVYNPKNGKYEFIHVLSDDYNIRHNLYDTLENKTVRHHVDFNKFNNNPTNILRVGWREHRKIHYDQVSYTNSIGLTGFKRANELHPEQARESGIKRAFSTWHGKNAKQNRIDVSQRNKQLNKSGILNSKEQRLNNSIRMSEWNTTSGMSFKERNNEELFKNSQKFSKIKKVCLLCNGKINEESYELNRKKFYNYPLYTNAKSFLESIGFDITNIDKNTIYKNHTVANIEFIDCEEDVYCLTCQEFGNFALSSGVFVHNCGMLTVKLKDKDIDLEKLDVVINKFIPSGFNVHSKSGVKRNSTLEKSLYSLKCQDKVDLKRALLSVGTLGGGNHFIEVDKGSDGSLYLVIHTGSRKLGGDVCKYYQDKAFQNVNEVKKVTSNLINELKREGREKEINEQLKLIQKPSADKDLACLEGNDFDDYLHDMAITQMFAVENRNMIANIILKNTGLVEDYRFETIHNYIDFKRMILRKGAVSAELNETLLIPINMRDGSLLCKGKGNEEWNFSAPHGAGRLMSRSKAKENISLESFEDTMKGIYTSSVMESTIDEAPQAYKDMDEIVRNIQDTVEVMDIIKPIYNFKAH